MHATTLRHEASQTQLTDDELLLDLGLGDEAAFLELYQRHRDPVFRFAFRMLGTVELAEDVAHDCFLSLIQYPTRFDPTRSSLRTYLFAAARNLAMKHFRKAHQDLSVDEFDQDKFVSGSDLPLLQLLDNEVSKLVQEAISNLPPLQREALILFEYEETALAEIARIVGADVGTVKARLFRARQALKRSLTQYFNGKPARVALEEVTK